MLSVSVRSYYWYVDNIVIVNEKNLYFNASWQNNTSSSSTFLSLDFQIIVVNYRKKYVKNSLFSN